MTRVPSAMINGLGRFGLGVLSAWFEDRHRTYSIDHINDDVLTIEQIATTLRSDPVVQTFHRADVRWSGDTLSLTGEDGRQVSLRVTTGDLAAHSREQKQLLFDCSGRASNFARYKSTLSHVADLVLIGATTVLADATLIMGYNETDFDRARHRVVSFGSCTVIPGIHILNRMQRVFGVRAVLINIVHSVPRWQLEQGKWAGLARKVCSLEAAAATLIPDLPPQTTKVNYTYAPYAGASLMDFAFDLFRPASPEQILEALSVRAPSEHAPNIVGLVASDRGGQAHLMSRTSIDIVAPSIDVRHNRAYFFGYFNNDGSGNRLHELAKDLLRRSHKPA